MTRRAQYKLQMPIVPEHDLQRSIVRVLTLEIAPAGKLSREGVVFWCVDHANYAGEVPGIRVGRGIIAGQPDLVILFMGRAYHIEIKSDNGVLEPAQQALITSILGAGGRVGMARNAEDVLALLDTWLIPRNNRVKVMA